MAKDEKREFVQFENQGQKIYGTLHVPLINEKCPVVVMCHGFAGNRIGRFRIYVLLAQRLSQLGIASLRFDFRGSGESDGDFSEMTIEGEVGDALEALKFVKSLPQIDSKRVGMLGNSFGGAVAVLASCKDKSVKSLALLAALFNSDLWKNRWEAMKTADEASKKELSRLLEEHTLGVPFLKEFFMLNIENAMQKIQELPILHIHSERDERVGIDQAEHYLRCRKDVKGETHTIRLTQSGHDFSNSEERNTVIEETAKWFLRTL